MNYQEIKNLRKKIEKDPILTDEEIEYIWMAMDKQDVQNPMKSKNGTDYINGLGWCQICDSGINNEMKYCCECGQKLIGRTK